MTNTVTQEIQFQFLALPAKTQLSAWAHISHSAPAYLDFPFIDGAYGNLRAGAYILCAFYKQVF